jgi:hypothetical protein
MPTCWRSATRPNAVLGLAGASGIVRAADARAPPLESPDDFRVYPGEGRPVPATVAIGRRTFTTIGQNLWFTAAYNVIGIALAAGGWLPPIAPPPSTPAPDREGRLNHSCAESFRRNRSRHRPLASLSSFTRLSRSAFAMTDTELNVIAALAMIGLKRSPATGYSTPAATGTPSAL